MARRIQIRHVFDALHRGLEARAAKTGMGLPRAATPRLAREEAVT